MELLLLDTTEKEGEDNKLYHCQRYQSQAAPSSISTTGAQPTSSWRELRGVLAAAVGATSSVCGEPLQCAHFRSNGSTAGDDTTGVVGFVNLYEVLYVLVFPRTVNVPNTIAQYYTRSSCDLMLSFFGYPDAKLSEWGGKAEPSQLKERLDSFFATVFAIIEQDLSCETHLQFAFRGRVPVINYPLDVLAELSVLELLDKRDGALDGAEIAGRCIRFRDAVVLSTIRPDFMRLANQWVLLEPGNFVPQASFASTKDVDGFNVFTFELHDFHFARHGFYPKRHTLLILERDDLQVVYLVQKDIKPGNNAEKPFSNELLQRLDVQSLQQLSQLASSTLAGYHDAIQKKRLGFRTSVLLADAAASGSTKQPALPGFLSYFVVHDLLRDVIIGESFQESCSLILDSGERRESALTAQKATYAVIFSLFVDRIATFQHTYQSSEPPAKRHETLESSDPDLPTWIPPVKLEVDDPNTLFLHEKSSDSGTDISSEDAHIFPPPGETLFTAPKAQPGSEFLTNRLVHQDAESHVITSSGQKLWVVANYYETVNVFAVFDADLVTLDKIEQEMDHMCTFGGYARI